MATVWDIRASLYDVCEASDYRRGTQKAALFNKMRRRVLFAAIGTGVDIKHFAPGQSIAAIDISDKMLSKAEKWARQYHGHLVLYRADAQDLKFPSASFDTVVTSCTMCSVPDPFRAFREFHRVLRPGGLLLMFECHRSVQMQPVAVESKPARVDAHCLPHCVFFFKLPWVLVRSRVVILSFRDVGAGSSFL